MASTYSTNLGVQLIADGENAGTWGQITNNNMGTATGSYGLLEQAISGYKIVTIAGGTDTALTIPDYADGNGGRNLMIEFTGGGSGAGVTLPTTRNSIAMSKSWYFYNNTTYAVTIKPASGTGATISIPAGAKMAVAMTTAGDVIELITNINALATRSIQSTSNISANLVSPYITSTTQTTIPVDDLSVFPVSGYVQILGSGEVIYYSSKSAATGAGNLVLASSAQRGALSTTILNNPVPTTVILINVLGNGTIPTYAPTPLNGSNTQAVATTQWVMRNVSSKIQPITASTASSALTVTLNPTVLDFRSTTLTNGSANTVRINPAISLTVPSGATLGSTTGIAFKLIVLAIDSTGYTGEAELAISILGSGLNLDETNLISTTALSGASNSATTIYSTTARTNVAYRVVGFVDFPAGTAGTWATITEVQGTGGQPLAALSSLGYGQSYGGTWASGTIYYNTYGKPIFVSVCSDNGVGNLGIYVNGVQVAYNYSNPTNYRDNIPLFAIVPPGNSWNILGTTTFITVLR